MQVEDPESKRKQLEQAIAAQEGLRGVLDEAIIETTLAALRDQLSALTPEPPAVDQQRKQVTILFMDVVGSTRLTRELDPEESMAVMDTALNELAGPISAHGGKVTRFMGDGFLAVFGLPKARENEPEMAVRAGLDILEKADTIAQNLARERKLVGFQVRVGVNTGLVVAGGLTEAEGTLMGSAVNLAARLESAAPPGGLLISQQTYPHVRGIFDLEPVEAIQAKGFDSPVRVYRVLRARPHTFQVKTRGVEGVETHMVGRQAEMQALQDALRDISQQRKSRFITVVAEAGVGKSRLLVEFENWLVLQSTPIALLKGRSTPGSVDLPYGLLRDLFAGQTGILDDDPVQVVREKIVHSFKTALGENEAYERNAHFVGQLLGYDFSDSSHLEGAHTSPQQLRDRAIVYMVDMMKAFATKSPIGVFLDDIHWSDDSSLEVLAQLCEDLSDQPVLFVALTRPTLFQRRPDWGTGPRQQRLPLSPLTEQESEHLLAQVLQKVAAIPDQLRRLVVRYAEGNPFYLEELVKMLIEDGVIVKSEPAWEVQADRLSTLQVPATLTGVIQARLDRLPESERTVLQQASVVGRVFWDAVVAFINSGSKSSAAGENPIPEGIGTCLESLQAREMVFRREGSAFSDAVEYLFKHAVLQDVTYESVLIRERRTFHALVADWLIAHSGERLGEVVGLIAGHLEKAGRDEEALPYLCQAADAAADKLALDEALDFYNRALALTPEDDLERRFSLLMGQESVVSLQGKLDDHRTILETLDNIVEDLGDDARRIEFLLRKVWFAYYVSDFPGGLAEAKKAVAIAETLGDLSLSSQANYALAWMLHMVDDMKHALEPAETALAMAREAGDRRTEGNILNVIGLIAMIQGDFYTSLVHLEAFLAIAREIGDLERESIAINSLSVVLTRLGDFRAANEHLQRLLAISQETGSRIYESTALTNLAWVAASQEDWALARRYAEAAVPKKRQFEHTDALAEALLWLGHALCGLGKPGEAVPRYQESLAIRQELNQAQLAMGVHAALARAALALDDPKTALAHGSQIAAYLDAGGDLLRTWEPLRIYLSCWQALHQAGDQRAAGILETAHTMLQDQAERIPDATYRRCFLENIPWHREIVRIWEVE